MNKTQSGLGWAFLTVALALAGCGGGDAVPTAVGVEGGPHGGSMTNLPEGAGTVEYLMVADSTAKATKIKGRGKMRLVAYFANAGGTGAPDPAPSAVTFIDGSNKKHTLAAKPSPDEPSRELRYESEPFDSDHDIVGEFQLTLGSNPITVPVRSR